MDNLYAVDYDFIQTLANRKSNEVGYILENHMFNDECLDRVAPSSMDAVIEIAFSQGSGRGRR